MSAKKCTVALCPHVFPVVIGHSMIGQIYQFVDTAACTFPISTVSQDPHFEYIRAQLSIDQLTVGNIYSVFAVDVSVELPACVYMPNPHKVNTV